LVVANGWFVWFTVISCTEDDQAFLNCQDSR
jgi:hypothetical protein